MASCCSCHRSAYGDPDWEIEPTHGFCRNCRREVHPADVGQMQAIADAAVRHHDEKLAARLRLVRGEHLRDDRAREHAVLARGERNT